MRWKGASLCEYDGKLVETETATWSEFPNGGKAIVEQILASEERSKPKRAGLWEPQSGMRVGKLTIWVRLFEITKNYKNFRKILKIITEFTRSISSTRIGKPVLMTDVKVSKDKHISRRVDRENFIYIRWNRIKSCAQRRRRWWWLIDEKEVRHWVK